MFTHTYLSYFLLLVAKATNIFHMLIVISLFNDNENIEGYEIHDVSLSTSHINFVSISILMFQLNSTIYLKEICSRKEKYYFNQYNTSFFIIVSISSLLNLSSPSMSTSRNFVICNQGQND